MQKLSRSHAEVIKKDDPDTLRAIIQDYVDKVTVNPDKTFDISLKVDCIPLVPETGVEPVRSLLTDGF